MKIKDERLAEYVKKHPEMLDMLERLGISLGFGDKTTQEICHEYNIDIHFFLDLTKMIIHKGFEQSGGMGDYPISHTLNYLRNSHHAYLKESLPRMERYMVELGEKEEGREKDCLLLLHYYNEYKMECEKHFQNEEKNVFPYIEYLDSYKSMSLSDVQASIRKNSIDNYVRAHDSLDEKLNDLKNLIIKYFKPFREKEIIKSLLKMLSEFEEDLRNHERIENEILFRQTKILEKEILDHDVEGGQESGN